MATSSAPRHPRVGLAVFLVDDRGYILIGKRQGAHGSGTLALPGGHLEWNESFEECAHREVLEETGIDLYADVHVRGGGGNGGNHEGPVRVGQEVEDGRGIKFLTALNCIGITNGQGTSPEGAHYVTIFMRARVHRQPGEREVHVKVMEPEKCSGWVWVPLNYLFSSSEAQASIERMEASAKQQGISLGVSMEKLLLAERLGERMRNGGNRQLSLDLDLEAVDRNRFEPQEDEEYVAYALADDLAQGAVLFRPLADLCRQQEKLVRQELSITSPTSPSISLRSPLSPAGGLAPRLPPGILHQDATAVINEALSSPPHLKHVLTLSFPTPTPRHAQNLVAILSVDRPLRPNDSAVRYETRAASVHVELKASTVRLLRLAGNSMLEDVTMVLKTMQAFPGPGIIATSLTAHAGQPRDHVGAEALEEGTVGKVERP